MMNVCRSQTKASQEYNDKNSQYSFTNKCIPITQLIDIVFLLGN